MADNLGVEVISLVAIEGLDQKDIIQLTVTDAESWSALTLRAGEKHIVVYNPAQSPARINSVVMHELSHIISGHQLAAAGMTSDGHLIPSQYSQEQEDEADWLAGTLLLPRPALMWMRKHGLSETEAMEHFQVSKTMLTWRIRMTGVDAQLNRYRGTVQN